VGKLGDQATDGQPGNRNSIPSKGRNVSFSTMSRPALGSTQPLIQGVQYSIPGVKRPTRKANHSPPPSSEVKNVRFTSAPPLLHNVVLNYVQEQFQHYLRNLEIPFCVRFSVTGTNLAHMKSATSITSNHRIVVMIVITDT
jgi:hypothetical protein